MSRSMCEDVGPDEAMANGLDYHGADGSGFVGTLNGRIIIQESY